MNKNENAIKELQKGIKTCVDLYTKNLEYDKTLNGIITKINNNNKYDVIINNMEYKGLKTLGGTCEIDEIVKIKIPLNNYNKMYIEKYKSDGGGGGSITIDSELSLTSTNPVQNKVITKKIDEVFTFVSKGKELIASAITDKGVKTDKDATFKKMYKNIYKTSCYSIGNNSIISNMESEVKATKILFES